MQSKHLKAANSPAVPLFNTTNHLFRHTLTLNTEAIRLNDLTTHVPVQAEDTRVPACVARKERRSVCFHRQCIMRVSARSGSITGDIGVEIEHFIPGLCFLPPRVSIHFSSYLRISVYLRLISTREL